MLSPAPASGSHSPLPGCYFFFVFLRFLRFCSTSMATTKSLVCFASTYGMPPAVLIFLIAARSSASGAKLHMQNGISCHSIAFKHSHGVQTPAEHLGHVTAVGGRMPTVGEDYLPLHEMSTNSKRTTCLPPHMVCEVHHTKSGYEQLESRNSPFRPTRS